VSVKTIKHLVGKLSETSTLVIMPIPLYYKPNGKISWKEKLAVPSSFDSDTRKPVFEFVTTEIPVWLEIPKSTGAAAVWDSDESSEFLKINLIGRAFKPLPANITQLAVIDIELYFSLEGISSFQGQVFPRGTTALRYPTLLLGDPFRVVARSKATAKQGLEYLL
jgi:hypothetical protein